jgi:hypothetical protein
MNKFACVVGSATLLGVGVQKSLAHANDPYQPPLSGMPATTITVLATATDTGTMRFPTDLARSFGHFPFYVLTKKEHRDS